MVSCMDMDIMILMAMYGDSSIWGLALKSPAEKIVGRIPGVGCRAPAFSDFYAAVYPLLEPFEERNTLHRLLNERQSLRQIAGVFGRSLSSLSREVNRTGGAAGYDAHPIKGASRD